MVIANNIYYRLSAREVDENVRMLTKQFQSKT